MTVIGRLKESDFFLASELNERMPPIQNGLVAHFPLDGKAGTFDGFGGHGPVQNTLSKRNLIEAHNLDWRNPSNWTQYSGTGNLKWDDTEKALVADGYWWGVFNGYIYIDPNKQWYVSAIMKKIGANGTVYLGDVAYDINKAQLSNQHPGTHEYFGLSATTISSTWTKYTNAAIAGAPRTGTSGTSTDLDKFEPATAYIKPVIVANYSNGVAGTDKVYIKALSWYYSDADTTTFTATNNGIAIESGTTNLWTGGLGIYNNYSPTVEGSVDPIYNQKYMGQQTYRLSIRTTDPTRTSEFKSDYGGHGVRGGNMQYTAGTTYTASIYWRPVNKADIILSGYPSNIGGWTNLGTFDIGDGWKKSVVQITPEASNSDSKFWGFICPSYQIGETIYIDFACPQIEATTYSTSYTQGTRNTSYFQLPPNLININNGAISIDFFYETTKYSNGSNQYMMLTHSYVTNSNVEADKINIVINNGKIFTRFAATSTDNTTGFTIASLKPGWNTYVISWNKSTKQIKESLNGILQTQTLVNVPQSPPAFFYIGSWSASGLYANVLMRNLSIYNRYLEDYEMEKLSKPSFSLTKAGNIIAETFIEQPNNIPSEALYFPLAYNGKDITKRVGPTVNNDASYDSDSQSLWLGPDMYNQINRPLSLTSYHEIYTSGVGVTDLGSSIKNGVAHVYFYRTLSTGGDMRWRHTSDVYFEEPTFLHVTKTKNFVFSVDVKVLQGDGAGFWVTGPIVTSQKLMFTVLRDGSAIVTNGCTLYSNVNIGDGFKRISVIIPPSFFTGSGNTGKIEMYQGWTTIGINETIIRRPQIEQCDYPTPFVTDGGFRPETSVNYNTDILNFNEGTILFTIKPMSPIDYSRIFAFGSYTWPVTTDEFRILFDNTNYQTQGSKGVYFEIQSKTNGASIGTGNSMVQCPINKETQIGVTWSKSALKIAIFKNGNLVTRDSTGSLVFPNYAGLSQIRLEPGCNSYLRDLIIVRRVLSDAEIANIHKTKLRDTQGVLRVQGKFREGQVMV